MTALEIDLVLAGGGSLGPSLIGAMQALTDAGAVFRRIAGTSVGGVVAAAAAHDLSFDAQLVIARDMLRGNRLLDPSWWPPRTWGLHKGQKAHKFLRQQFPGRMDAARTPWGVFAVDVERRAPIWIDSVRDGQTRTADAVSASIAIPGWFAPRRIRGRRGLFIDGGTAVNFGLGVYDDHTRPTIGIRFQTSTERKPVTNLVEYGSAIASVLLDNSNRTYVSKKRYARVIDIPIKGDPLDFSLTRGQVDALVLVGQRAAQAAVKVWGWGS